MSHQTNSYEFGPYHLDLRTRVLMRGGEGISLAPKATDILVMLVTNAGQLVEKDELLKGVWPDSFVEESNLTQNIFRLRKVLGEDKTEPKYIETVTKRGYRFVAPVKCTRILEDTLTSPDSRPHGPSSLANGRLVIAVLPFKSTNIDHDYFADGLTDNIINNLSRLPQLRVMSRTAIFRYSAGIADPQLVGKELGAHAVLIGRIRGTSSGVSIDVELIDPWTGWQLWGENFDFNGDDLLQIQNTIIRLLIFALKTSLAVQNENSVITRFTENSEAYESYLEGRHQWGNFSRASIQKAIEHFKKAIRLESHYALAYVGIIDCYLRLATEYLPPEEKTLSSSGEIGPLSDPARSDQIVKLRFEWDWKNAERELRRATDLQTSYPSVHQWYAAYSAIRTLYEDDQPISYCLQSIHNCVAHADKTPREFASLELTLNEQVQIYCAISRDQIDAGNYEAASLILKPWWSFGRWPTLGSLKQTWCADLLFTCGELAGCVASTLQIPQGQRHGEELLSGSIALFEQLGFTRRVVEARIELALCYYRQGLFEMGRSTLLRILEEIASEDSDLRSLALIRLAILERQAGRLHSALAYLTEATTIMDRSGPWVTCRCHIELASTYKDLAIAEDDPTYFDTAKRFYLEALQEFEAIGNHRYVGIVENNLGFLLLSIGSFQQSEFHLLRSRMLFERLNDLVRTAQVNETLARLYIATKQFHLAEEAIELAVGTLELTDNEALLAEALTTSGIVKSKLGYFTQAKKSFEAAHRIADRCGDREGAGRAILVMVEEINDCLDRAEILQISKQLKSLASVTQQTAVRTRAEKAIAVIELGQW